MSANELRERLRFDVERLRAAAGRVEAIDGRVNALRSQLEARARTLSVEATHQATLPGHASVLAAQAHALAHLSKRVSLHELLADPGGESLSIIFVMAASRWLAELRREPKRGRSLRLEIEAGRVAHRVLRSLRRGRGLAPGFGKLVSAVVVFEFADPAERTYLEGLIVEEMGADPESAARVCSAALREAALVLEWAAQRAEPHIDRLEREANVAEGRVRQALTKPSS